MSYDALLERGVILCTAENIGHDLTKNGTTAEELHHARGDGSAEKGATVKTADDLCSEFQFTREGCADPVSVHLRIALGDGFAEEFARAHGVKETFTSERIDESGGIADERPVFSDDSALGKRGNLRRRKDMAVKARGFSGKFLLADEHLQVSAKFVLVVRSHAAANSDG